MPEIIVGSSQDIVVETSQPQSQIEVTSSIGRGVPGPTGETGATGPTGPVGPEGPQGPQGLTGNVGPTGPVGPAGPTGPTGAPGAPGVDGRTVLSGTAVPTTEGVNGDFYIRTSTNFIYGPKAGGVWPAGVSLVGPTGATGATGATGPTGPTGAPGTDGATWYNGAGAPAGGLGVIGDYYLNNSNGDVYEKTGVSTWGVIANITGPSGSGSGDMLASVYDPQAIASDAFDQDNMTDGVTNKNYTATEKTKLGFISVTQAVDLDTMESDIAGKQPLDGDLTSWAGVTRAAGFDTFVATPTSANLAALLTDETGTGAAVFGTSPTLTTSATINGPAATNRSLFFRTAGSTRLEFGASNAAEGGANAGSDLFLNTYDDAGAYLATPLVLTRSTGKLIVNNGLGIDGGTLTAANDAFFGPTESNDPDSFARIRVSDTDGNSSDISISVYDASYGALYMSTAGGTPSAPTDSSTSDIAGKIAFQSFHTALRREVADITVYDDGPLRSGTALRKGMYRFTGGYSSSPILQLKQVNDSTDLGSVAGLQIEASDTINTEAPTISAIGSLTNIGIDFKPKGNKTIRLLNSSGNPIVNVQRTLTLPGTDTGVLINGVTAEPSAPAAGNIEVYSKSIAGRMSLKTKGPAGIDTPLQNAFWGNNIVMWTPTTATAGVWFGTAGSSAGTYTTALPTTTSLYTATKRGRWANVVTTTNQILGTRSLENLYFRGSVAGQGGFFYFARLGFDIWTNGGRFFAGISPAGGPMIQAEPSVSNNSVGFCVDSGDAGVISFFTRNGTTTTKVSTGYTITSGKGYDVYIFCAPNSSQYTWRIVDVNAGTEASGTATATLPVNTTTGAACALASNAALTPVDSIQIGVNRVYVETDR